METGGYYAGNDHAVGYPTLRYDIFGMHRRTWDAGNEPYLQKNDPKYTEITEPERKMAEHVEIKRQASSQNEPFRMVSIPVQYFPSGSVCFSEQQTGTQRRSADALSLYRSSSSGRSASASAGTGFFV